MDRCDDEAPALPGLRAFWGTKGLRGGRTPLLARERSSLPSNSPPSPQRALSGDEGCVVRCMRKRESPQACGRRERACLRPYGHRQQRATGWRPEAVPVTTKEVTGIESWLEGEPFLEKVSLPRCLACAFYSWARPMPGRAASRPAPRRKRPASSKALPMSCMPTGILLSAAMPTGRDRPGRPARFRDRV